MVEDWGFAEANCDYCELCGDLIFYDQFKCSGCGKMCGGCCFDITVEVCEQCLANELDLT